MHITFTKYQGTGNDFILLDNLSGKYDNLTTEQISFLCHRKLGIGADGLIKINSHSNYEFEVDYSNADGSKSFCGNGARCSVAFAQSLGLVETKTTFLAIDGVHQAKIKEKQVELEMLPVSTIEEKSNDFILDTGSPHFVRFIDNIEFIDIVELGKSIRYSEVFKQNGINVNAVEILSENHLKMQTYERGVEDETLSCGTGVTASVLAYLQKENLNSNEVKVETKGGVLSVKSQRSTTGFDNIWLIGSTQQVFQGEINV